MRAKIPPSIQGAKFDMVAPGSRGLNLQQQAGIISPGFATEAQNAIIDSDGRLASRDGITNLTSTPITGTPMVRSIHEHLRADTSTATIVAWDGGISTSVTDPEGSDISGAVVDADGRWKFVNFNDKCIGFQAGQKLIVRTTANFANVVETSGTAPTGGVGTAAYGRIWQVDSDGKTIKYSGLLNETQWNSGGAGSIDMTNIWTKGTDVIVAIEEFNHRLLVFGRKHIVFLGDDGAGGALGLDVTTLAVKDIITGTGCVTQHSIQAVGDTDMLYLSPTGVQSLKRVLVERSNPITNLTKYVRDSLLANVQMETADDISSVYSDFHGFYLLSMPTSQYTWVLDQRKRMADEDSEEVCAVTRWNIAPTALAKIGTGDDVYVAFSGGQVGQYLGDTDEGETFRFIYLSPWLDLGEEIANRLKILKRLGSILLVRNAVSVLFKWYVDFQLNFKSASRTIEGGTSAEWGLAEFGEAEYSGGQLLRIVNVPARGTAQYFRIGIEADVTGEFAIAQSELFAKIGRLA